MLYTPDFEMSQQISKLDDYEIAVGTSKRFPGLPVLAHRWTKNNNGLSVPASEWFVLHPVYNSLPGSAISSMFKQILATTGKHSK